MLFRSGSKTRALVEKTIQDSIQVAQAQPERIMPLVSGLARELDAIVLKQHIKAYVNDLSLDMGTKGMNALNTLQTFWKHA